MYENLTVEEVKTEILEKLTSDIDIREGSFFNDMISAVAYVIWKNYQSLDAIIPIAYVDETSGEYIDKRCSEYGITPRKSGKQAKAVLTIAGTNGTIIPKGKVFITNDENELEFTSDEMVTITGGSATVSITAIEVGELYNVGAGVITRQFVNLSGITNITNAAATGGSDAETNASLVDRLYTYLKNPSTSGNANHYEQWALEVDGVGSAKVKPLWNGPGTVKVMIIGSNKEPVDTAIVTNCTEHIETYRPIGASVTVESAAGFNINVTAVITIKSSTTLEAVQASFETALGSYLKSIAFITYTVVYNRIAYILLDIDGVIDYTSLKINGSTVNITMEDNEVPVIGSVVIS